MAASGHRIRSGQATTVPLGARSTGRSGCPVGRAAGGTCGLGHERGRCGYGTWALADITAEEVGKWEREIIAQGFARRTARDARTTLTTILNDAIPRHIKVNPAARKRGKGRKGQRRIEHHEQAEKVWATPLQVLLISERIATLTGRDEDFLMGVTGGYTGMRWSELCGLMPDYVLPDYIPGDMLDVQWKLYELGGHFYPRPPKRRVNPAQ